MYSQAGVAAKKLAAPRRFTRGGTRYDAGVTNPFVSTAWLASHLDDPGVVVVDASWYLPDSGRSGEADYLQSHLPGAVFFDLDAIADRTTTLPHMLPAPADFAAAVSALGIGSAQTIVVYDELGLFSAPRVWWTFRAMGATDVRILDGGGRAWRAEGRPTAHGPSSRPAQVFTASLELAAVAGLADVSVASQRGHRQIVDARPAERFRGEVPEPRPGLRSGHIPGSLNVPASALSADGKLRNPEELKAIFAAAGLDLNRPIVTTCGSGVTAATLALALGIAGAPAVAVYDGSWAEWGGRSDVPAER